MKQCGTPELAYKQCGTPAGFLPTSKSIFCATLDANSHTKAITGYLTLQPLDLHQLARFDSQTDRSWSKLASFLCCKSKTFPANIFKRRLPLLLLLNAAASTAVTTEPTEITLSELKQQQLKRASQPHHFTNCKNATTALFPT
eukprot:4774342-Pleurochrysis_carterae.AAC.1